MTSRSNLLAMTALTALLAGPALAQTAPAPSNPPGTAAGRAVDRAAGTNNSGALPQNSDGTPGNPPGTAAGRAAESATSGVPSSSTPPNPAASTAAPSAPTTGSVAQPSTLGTSPSASGAPVPGSTIIGSRPTAAADHQRASKIVGTSVYNDRNESIGSVDDLVLGANGTPTVVVSVGGFLGIGAKLVAVPFEELRWNGNESRWVIAGATRDSLTSLPVFEYGSSRG